MVSAKKRAQAQALRVADETALAVRSHMAEFTKELLAKQQLSSPLFSLPSELLTSIILEITDFRTLYRLARTCRRFAEIIINSDDLSSRIHKAILDREWDPIAMQLLNMWRPGGLTTFQKSRLKTGKTLMTMKIVPDGKEELLDSNRNVWTKYEVMQMRDNYKFIGIFVRMFCAENHNFLEEEEDPRERADLIERYERTRLYHPVDPKTRFCREHPPSEPEIRGMYWYLLQVLGVHAINKDEWEDGKYRDMVFDYSVLTGRTYQDIHDGVQAWEDVVKEYWPPVSENLSSVFFDEDPHKHAIVFWSEKEVTAAFDPEFLEKFWKELYVIYWHPNLKATFYSWVTITTQDPASKRPMEKRILMDKRDWLQWKKPNKDPFVTAAIQVDPRHLKYFGLSGFPERSEREESEIVKKIMEEIWEDAKESGPA